MAIQARKFSKPLLFQMTGGHKGTQYIAERNCECVILKKMVIGVSKPS